MRLSLIPRKNIFFTQFSQHAQNALEANYDFRVRLSLPTRIRPMMAQIIAGTRYRDGSGAGWRQNSWNPKGESKQNKCS